MPEAHVKKIVCLANSRKMMGMCVAGKEIVGSGVGSWVRPVSHRPKQEVSLYERQFVDGGEPGPLDVIDVPLLAHSPNVHQVENWLLYPRGKWARVGRLEWKYLFRLEDRPPALWINGSRTMFGSNDRVKTTRCRNLQGSLYLLHLERLKLHVFTPGAGYGEAWLRVHGEFTYAGINYRMWVTDPVIEAQYKAKGTGIYTIGECFVTLSLGEPHTDGYCYKLVAAVMLP